tara:strand:- start:41428 stop:41685 length:258 start_codon:yes stop_codon:yes gene_type:complete
MKKLILLNLLFWIIIISLFSCKTQIKRSYRDIKELESVELSDWKGWVVLAYPDSKTAIIRNNNRILKVQVPKWFLQTFNELDTIK